VVSAVKYDRKRWHHGPDVMMLVECGNHEDHNPYKRPTLCSMIFSHLSRQLFFSKRKPTLAQLYGDYHQKGKCTDLIQGAEKNKLEKY